MEYYPQNYLNGNIELQNLISKTQVWHVNTAAKWLLATVAMFILLLIGVTFESTWVSLFSIVELIICGTTLYYFSSPNELAL